MLETIDITSRLTEEQRAIIQSAGNITINAVAGSGKTTTLVEYAATRPAGSRILYLAFNKSVKIEATRRFRERGLHNVKVETAHSLAYKAIVPQNDFKVSARGYNTQEIAGLLNLRVGGEKHAEYIVANHINKFITFFCNSNKEKVQDLNYLDTITDKKAKNFARAFYKFIVDGVRQILAMMKNREIEITHDFYLKLFQLSHPVLQYDYILFDEGQDASEAMLDVFLRQKATKLIVGDAHQQIYGWRFAVNSLEKTIFTKYTLNTSFRFNQSIAALAMEVLAWKANLGNYEPARIVGKGKGIEKVDGKGKLNTTKATIARSNVGLLIKAIEYIREHKEVKSIYFEGNINSYTYADDGASLYDVLALYNGNHQSVRDKLIKSMNDMEELEDYIKKTEDVQLGMMVEIVNEYGNEIYALIRSLKALHCGDEGRANAEMIFSTVHKSKGMEYDEVQLVNDFVTQSKIESQKAATKEEEETLNRAKWNEEINLLYVAITRTKAFLKIPEALMPKNFNARDNIEIFKTQIEDEPFDQFFSNSGLDPKSGHNKKWRSYQPKTYPPEDKKKINRKAYMPWTDQLDEELKILYESGMSPDKIAKFIKRGEIVVVSRLRKLGLVL